MISFSCSSSRSGESHLFCYSLLKPVCAILFHRNLPPSIILQSIQKTLSIINPSPGRREALKIYFFPSNVTSGTARLYQTVGHTVERTSHCLGPRRLSFFKDIICLFIKKLGKLKFHRLYFPFLSFHAIFTSGFSSYFSRKRSNIL